MFLKEIISQKMKEVEGKDIAQIRRQALRQSPPLSFPLALKKAEGISIIAEIKRASPSKGILKEDLDHLSLARAYVEGGARAISVITEKHYFKGNLEHLLQIKKYLKGGGIPVLRKDFILSTYQVYESKAYGADSLLLISAILEQDALKGLTYLSRELGMEPLVEVHNEGDLNKALNAEAYLIGINNRDLTTWQVDLETTLKLLPLIPKDKMVVSESGIRCREDIERLKGKGVTAFLVGEALILAEDPKRKLEELIC